jgi:hypothetical protein
VPRQGFSPDGIWACLGHENDALKSASNQSVFLARESWCAFACNCLREALQINALQKIGKIFYAKTRLKGAKKVIKNK